MSLKSFTTLSLLLVNLSQSINVYDDREYTLDLAQEDQVTVADPSTNGGSLVEAGNATPEWASGMMMWFIITLWAAGITLAIVMLTGKNCYTTNEELFGEKMQEAVSN